MKKEYCVNVVYTMVHTMWVEAESEEEAKNAALGKFGDEPDFSDDEIDSVEGAYVVRSIEQKLYKVRYKGRCGKGGRMEPNGHNVGKAEYWTMDKILYEINGGRSDDWTKYTEENWKEGLNEWTEWEPV